jgi:lysophospholipase L1-like esterase
MREERRRGRIAVNLLISATSVVLFLGLLELAVREIDPKLPLLLSPTAENCLRRSASLSLAFRPRCSGVLSGTPLSTNSAGLRGPELRADGSPRILAIGDSCTWGWHVAEDESYPAVLQRLLETRSGPKRFAVVNAGFPGYTSYQGLVYLRENGVALAPRVVVMGFGFNDANEVGDIEQQIEYERRHPMLVRLDDWLLASSRLYVWMRWKRSGLAADGEEASGPPKVSGLKPGGPGPRVSLEKYVTNLEEMVKLARDHGADPILLSFWPEEGARVGRRVALEVVADKWDVPLIVYDGERLDIVHPTAEGYRRLAARIAAELEARGDLQ